MSEDENNSEVEDFEDEEDGTYEYKPSYIIVAIDTHPSMFQRDENGRLPFRNCLESCLRILNSLLLVKDYKRWNPFAVLLTRDDPKLIDFGNNVIESIKLLQSKLELSDEDLEDEYQRKNDFDLAEFLLQCKKGFHDIKAQVYKRNLVFITNDDNPVKNAQAKFTAINEIKSFDASSISFEVIPTNRQFDFSLLYNEMFAQMSSGDKKEVEEICADVDGLEQKLSSVLLPKSNISKVKFYPIRGDSNTCLNCFDFKLVHSSKFLNTKLTVDGKEIKSKPPPLTADLPNYSLVTPHTCNHDVVFDFMKKNELFNTSYPRGYTLICIGKPLLEPVYNDSKPRVLLFSNNYECFRKFWEYCTVKERVLICVVKFKQPGKIKFCQMSPIMLKDMPLFLCKEIPFVNNIGHFDDNPVKIEKNEKNYDLVRKLVDKLIIDFHPDMIPEPAFRKKKEYLTSKLLDKPYQDNIELFDQTSLDSRIRDEVERIKDAFHISSDQDPGAKRKRAANTAAASRKKKN